jgi:predicted nucleotidyltransferase
MDAIAPTADQAVNALLTELVQNVQHILDHNLIAAYLHGSFAVGDWDSDSDIDFLVVTETDVTATELAALQAMHARVYALPTAWAQHLEGSYAPQATIRQIQPPHQQFLFLDNTSDHLVWSPHDNTQYLRWVVRTHGITLVGPAPDTLIDPVDANALRQEALTRMHSWADQIFSAPEQMNNRWYQPYAVLSYCRMLYTVATGTAISKPAGARWAQQQLDHRWAGLIAQAWDERPNPSLKAQQAADPKAVQLTLAFIQEILGVADKYVLAPSPTT